MLTKGVGVLAVMTSCLLAQDRPNPIKDTSSSSPLASRKVLARAEMRSAAASMRLAAIKLQMHGMLVGFQLAHDFTPGSDADAAVFAEGQKEVLEQIAKQLESFIEQFGETAEAQDAKAILARIYMELDQPDAAAKAVADFDADLAKNDTVLQTILHLQALEPVAKDTDAKLKKLVMLEGDAAKDTFLDAMQTGIDAVFVATRLGKLELAGDLLKTLDEKVAAKKDADSFEHKAAYLLAKAELLAKIGRKVYVPAAKDDKLEYFNVNPISSDRLSKNKFAAPLPWDADAAKEKLEVEAVDSSAKVKGVWPDEYGKSKLHELMAKDAADGLTMIICYGDILKDKDDAFAGKVFEPAKLTPEEILAGLLRKLAMKYPGTQAAKIAADRIRSEKLEKGDPPVWVEGKTIADRDVSLAQLKDRVVLLHAWCTADKDSMAELAEITRLHKEFHHAGFEIIGINLDVKEDEWLVHDTADRFAMDWPVICDGFGTRSALVRSLGIDALPWRLVIGKDGRVFEARPSLLTVKALPTIVQAALREPDDASAEEREAYAAAKAAAEASGEEQKIVLPPFTGVPGYSGPPISAALGVMESLPLQYELLLKALVPDASYALRLDRTEHVDGVTDVYITLAGQALPDELDDVQVTTVRARLPLGSDLGSFVRVFARNVIDGAHYFVDPAHAYLTTLPVEAGNRKAYVGPKIETKVTEDGKGGEKLEAQVVVPSKEYAFAVERVDETAEGAQVHLKLISPKTLALDDDAAVKKLEAALKGKPKKIEVFVDFRRDDEQKASQFVCVIAK